MESCALGAGGLLWERDLHGHRSSQISAPWWPGQAEMGFICCGRGSGQSFDDGRGGRSSDMLE